MAKASRELPADEDRCTRSGFNNWRCPFPRHGGKRYCLKHHLSALEKCPKSKPASRVSDPSKIKIRPQEALLSRVSDPKSGEIWAFPQGSDNFPRSYARIDRILINSKNSNHPSLEATPLIPLPASDDEMVLCEKGLLLACGTFRSSAERIAKPISAFSHRVSVEAPIEGKWSSFYKIFPQKGEIWAVYQDYDGLTNRFRYKLVEVLSDFSGEDGVNVFGLEKVADEDGVYKRQLLDGFYMVRNFPRRDLSMFSHRVPAARIADDREKLWKVMLH